MIRSYAPKEISVDAANSPHLADFGSQADDLDAHVGALLDDDVGIVGELRGGGAGIVLDFVGHQLRGRLATGQSWHGLMGVTHMGGDKQA